MRGSTIAVAMAAALGIAASAASAQDQPLIGESAPAFELEALSGERVALEDYRGRIVVLHFGAGW